MVGSKFLILIALSSFLNNVNSQKLSIENFSKLEIKQKPFNSYFNKNGQTYDCGWRLECLAFAIVFYSVEIDKENNEVKLQGRTYLHLARRVDSMDKIRYGDTVGLPGISIFLARPVGQTLNEISGMSFNSYDSLETEYTKFPLREGDFNINLKIDKKTRLYFASPYYYLKEYDVGKLVK